MALQADLLKTPRPRYRIPEDPVGTRPSVETPAGAAQLLWITLVEIRYHWPRLLVVTLVAGLIGFFIVIVPLSWLTYWQFTHRGTWLVQFLPLAAWPLIVPFFAGCEFSLLLAIQGLQPKAREVFRPFRKVPLYFNVLVAAGLPALGVCIVGMAAESVAAWILPAAFASEHPTQEHLLRLAGSIARGILFMPFAFAGLDAVVRRCSFRAAIARSIHFTTTRFRLFVGYAALWLIAITANSEIGKYSPAQDVGSNTDSTMLSASWEPFLAESFLIFFAFLLTCVFYREFVWREQEDSAAAAAPIANDAHA
jgi:hypothetical protein